jgi:hypothetical protein
MPVTIHKPQFRDWLTRYHISSWEQFRDLMTHDPADAMTLYHFYSGGRRPNVTWAVRIASRLSRYNGVPFEYILADLQAKSGVYPDVIGDLEEVLV